MVNNKSETGNFGEDLACRFLLEKGYKIIERNFRKPWGEIDIIVKDSNKTLVFVEVKTMFETATDGLSPEDQLSYAKFKKIAKTSLGYTSANPNLVDKIRGWRIDLVAINLSKNKMPDIRHYENIGL